MFASDPRFRIHKKSTRDIKIQKKASSCKKLQATLAMTLLGVTVLDLKYSFIVDVLLLHVENFGSKIATAFQRSFSRFAILLKASSEAWTHVSMLHNTCTLSISFCQKLQTKEFNLLIFISTVWRGR